MTKTGAPKSGWTTLLVTLVTVVALLAVLGGIVSLLLPRIVSNGGRGREELGLSADAPIVFGDGASHPLLQALSED